MNIFFDLDGTLVDGSQRLYNLFQFLVPSSTLTKSQYWSLKRNKVSHLKLLKEQLGNSDEQIDRFQARWLSMIELPEWIALDKPFDGATAYLNELKKSINCT